MLTRNEKKHKRNGKKENYGRKTERLRVNLNSKFLKFEEYQRPIKGTQRKRDKRFEQESY